MGVNIYLQRNKDHIRDFFINHLKSYTIPNLSNKENVFKSSIDFNSFLEEDYYFLRNFTEPIHICKISIGWQVLFKAHNALNEKFTKESLFAFIKDKLDEGYELITEYGELYSLEELEASIKSHSNGYTLESYYEVPKFRDDEFISDDLRWTYSDFS